MCRRIFVHYLPPALLFGLLLAWLFREPLLVSAGKLLIRSDSPEKADLIYVLAGDFWGNRVLVGSQLGARGYAQRVLFSGGIYQGAYEGDMSVRFAVDHGYPQQLFLAAPLTAQSTIEEAIELRPIFQRLRAKSVLLVTSDFHSRRAALAFRLFIPGVHFLMVAAPDTVFDPNSWWKSPGGRRLVFSEYEKILGTFLAAARDW